MGGAGGHLVAGRPQRRKIVVGAAPVQRREHGASRLREPRGQRARDRRCDRRARHDRSESIVRANFTSVVSLLVPLANQLERQRSGKLGVITSVAGDRGRPRNYTYGAAKAALNTYLQGLRTRLYPSGVSITTLKLGPVDTPMTVGHRKHALFGEVPRVARSIVETIEAGTPEAYVPGFWRLIMPIVRSTPEAVFQRLPFLSGR
jgi:short-subunit dehydrogenase